MFKEWGGAGARLVSWISRLGIDFTTQTPVTPSTVWLSSSCVFMTFSTTSYNILAYIRRIILSLWRYISVSV